MALKFAFVTVCWTLVAVIVVVRGSQDTGVPAENAAVPPLFDSLVIGSCLPGGAGEYYGNCQGECISRGYRKGLCIGTNSALCRCNNEKV